MEEREEGKKEGRGSVKMGEQKGGGRRMEERRERRKEGKEKRERVNSCMHYLVVTLPHTLSTSSVRRGRMMWTPVIIISTNLLPAEHIIKYIVLKSSFRG